MSNDRKPLIENVWLWSVQYYYCDITLKAADLLSEQATKQRNGFRPRTSAKDVCQDGDFAL